MANCSTVLQGWPDYSSSSGEWIWLLCYRWKLHALHQGGKEVVNKELSINRFALIYSIYIYFKNIISVLFSFLYNTPTLRSLQALLSRGITELLLTSDNKDGLKLGGVKGGIVRLAGRQTSCCMHKWPINHTHILQYVGWRVSFLCTMAKMSEISAGQCCTTTMQNQILVLYQKCFWIHIN